MEPKSLPRISVANVVSEPSLTRAPELRTELPSAAQIDAIIAQVADDIDDTEGMPWVPSPLSQRQGVETKLVRVWPSTGTWVMLARYAAGTMMPRRRLQCEAHGFQLEGYRRLLENGRVIGPGSYAYQLPGIHPGFVATGDTPLMFWCLNRGPIEYLDDEDRVVLVYDVERIRAVYGPHCQVME